MCVDPEKVASIWPHVSHFIKAAYETGVGDDEFDSTQDDLACGRALLWIVWNDGEFIAACVTKIRRIGNRKVCFLVAASGRYLSLWRHNIKKIEEYAASNGCNSVRVEGRNGWARIFKEYSQPWVILEKRL